MVYLVRKGKATLLICTVRTPTRYSDCFINFVYFLKLSLTRSLATCWLMLYLYIYHMNGFPTHFSYLAKKRNAICNNNLTRNLVKQKINHTENK